MYLFKQKFYKLCHYFVVIALTATLPGCSQWSLETQKALATTDSNRSELEKVLNYYKTSGDAEKLAAAEFLISNMPGHGYVETGLYTQDANEISFDALNYETYEQAREALRQLKEENGELNFKRKSFTPDIDTITSEYLIENIDLAFETWRQIPWAKSLSFDAFCEYILPYRCSNEPVGNWRQTCLEAHAALPEKMTDPADLKEAGDLISKEAYKWVQFDTIYYLHPTDQGFEEMLQTRKGRCEDIANMATYIMRANIIPVASDYTPAWANRDNNHAWNVLLDSEGKGNAPLGNIAAKIYRKMFSTQPNSIVLTRKKHEDIPPWLRSKSVIDVTDQYFETSDIAIRLEQKKPKNISFAYLCVFNGGQWEPVCSGKIKSGRAFFEKLGRGIVYLPVYYYDKDIHPAAAPFILDKGGNVMPLGGSSDENEHVEITTLKPATDDDDTHVEIPQIVVEPNNNYEMFYWNGQWESLGIKTTEGESVFFNNLPANRLYWMVAEGSDKLERIFTIDNSRQYWW